MALNFALVGNPNSGKTTLFNELTGSTAHVGNWPGVTIDRREGKYKSDGQDINIIDLPGIYSLSPYTPEEVVARNYIINEQPDLIINIVDATNIERNLYLTTQILETDCPVIIALNMMDLVERQNDTIDLVGLEEVFGVPIIPISAMRADGTEKLISKAINVVSMKRKSYSVISGSQLESTLIAINDILAGQGKTNSLFHAAKMLENDPLVRNEISNDTLIKIDNLIDNANATYKIEDIEAMIADLRYKFVTSKCAVFITRSHKHGELTVSDKIDRVLTNKYLGIPIFLGFMFMVFHLTFGKHLLGMENVQSPGVWLQGLTETLMAFISDGITWLLQIGGASDWARGLIVDAMLGGVGAVLSFVPQIMLLFLFLSILEDSGYMARAAFIMDRLLRHFGLSGKSFLPMLMGFGCSVPALMATRTLENEKDRRITMMLVPFLSCGAKLPIYALFAGALFKQYSDLVTFAVYISGILIAVITGAILKKTVFKSETATFIMELPNYRMPRLKNLLIHLWDKLKGFIIKAGTVILGSTVIIWCFSNFNFKLQMVEANGTDSIIGIIGNTIRIFFIPLGFASGDDGWKSVVAIVTGLVAKEVVVSTLGVLYAPDIHGDVIADDGAKTALAATIATAFTPLAAISFMIFNLLSIPCMAAVSTMWSEMRSVKWSLFAMCLWLCIAWLVSFLVFNVGSLILLAF